MFIYFAGEPLHNAIVWLDTRTSETVAECVLKTKSKSLNEFREKSGVPIATYFRFITI